MFCERLKCQTLLPVFWKILLGLFGIALSNRRAEKKRNFLGNFAPIFMKRFRNLNMFHSEEQNLLDNSLISDRIKSDKLFFSFI